MEAIAKNDIDDLIGELKDGHRTVTELPHDGFLFLEHDVPFLLIYRKLKNDTATQRLARTAASYLIIGETNFDYFREFVNRLTECMSARFGSFIIMEIYSGLADSTEFVIRGPSHKLPVSLDVLRDRLAMIDSKKYGIQLSARIEQTKHRQQENRAAFFSIDEIKESGGTFIGLVVPPVYRIDAGSIYPVYFRKFRDSFASISRFLNLFGSKPPATLLVIMPLANDRYTRKFSKWTASLRKSKTVISFFCLYRP